jgi:hypothetical protein
MGLRIVEKLEGLGTILRDDGSEVGRKRYHLTVYEEVIDAGGQEVAGLRRSEGRIDAGDIFMESAELTLRLQDGRSLPFFFTDAGGRIAARGDLK